MSEVWLPVPGFDGLEASSHGQIRSRAQNLLPRRRVRRYLAVWLGKSLRYALVHRLVLLAFHGERPSPRHETLHLDADPTNNRPENLRWGTHAENMAMDRGNNHAHKREHNPNAKLSSAAVVEIRAACPHPARAGQKWGVKHLAKKYSVSTTQIRRIAYQREGGWK